MSYCNRCSRVAQGQKKAEHASGMSNSLSRSESGWKQHIVVNFKIHQNTRRLTGQCVGTLRTSKHRTELAPQLTIFAAGYHPSSPQCAHGYRVLFFDRKFKIHKSDFFSIIGFHSVRDGNRVARFKSVSIEVVIDITDTQIIQLSDRNLLECDSRCICIDANNRRL